MNITYWEKLLKSIAVAAVLVSCHEEGASQPLPNIVVIIADDLGWGDVGYHGSDIRTPNIDGLKREGMELDRFYVAPICSPTRAGLLTGRYPDRYGLRNNVIRPWLDFGLDTTEVTLPDLLAEMGYTNRALVGKWHLGHSRKAYHPLNRGYSYFYGHLNGAIDYFSFRREGERDWHENFSASLDSGYTTNLIGQKATDLIGSYASSGDPFYLQVAFNAPHSPLQAMPKYLDQYGFDPGKPTFAKGRGRGNSRRQTYAAMVTHMDHEIGEILSVIDSLEIADNTIVLFMSDNGGELRYGGSNGPLRGGKLTEWEGGVRVPAILRWPGKINSGSMSPQVMGYVDVAPTLLALIGVDLSGQLEFDGINTAPAILQGQELTRTLYLGNGTLLNQRYKLIEGGARVGLSRMTIQEDHFFDIQVDEVEENNLVNHLPQAYIEMKQGIELLNQIKSSVPKPKDDRPADFKAPERWIIEN